MVLRCEISKAGVPVEWYKGDSVIQAGPKYQMKHDGRFADLHINNLLPEDTGPFSCVTGGQKTTAEVKVNGGSIFVSETAEGHISNPINANRHHCSTVKHTFY